MNPTARGIYTNIKKSTYIVESNYFRLYFSSRFYLNKFLKEYGKYRTIFENRLIRAFTRFNKDYYNLNIPFMADMDLYRSIEKRGFYVTDWKGVELSWQEIREYALQIPTEKSTQDWQEMQHQS